MCASEPARRCLQGIYRARQPPPGSPASVGLPAETRSRDRWAGSLRLGFDGGFPRRVWRRIGQSIFEARQGSPGSGDYHGYPLTPEQAEDFQRRNAGF